MNPATPVQPSRSVTAAALLTHTHTSTLKYLLHSEGPTVQSSEHSQCVSHDAVLLYYCCC